MRQSVIKIMIFFLSILVYDCSRVEKEQQVNRYQDQILWTMKRKSIIDDCIISIEYNKIFLSTSAGIFCYDAESGILVWKNAEITYSDTLFVFGGSLIIADARKPRIYYINIETGKVTQQVSLEEYIFMLQVESKTTLLIVSHKPEYQFQLQRYNIISTKTDILQVFEGSPRNQLECYNGDIILTASSKTGENGTIYIVDGSDYRIKRVDTIYDNLSSSNKDFVCLQNSVYYIKRIDNRNELTRVDITTGKTENHELFFGLDTHCLFDCG
jgi:outer membrane protein assembly factor BamB